MDDVRPVGPGVAVWPPGVRTGTLHLRSSLSHQIRFALGLSMCMCERFRVQVVHAPVRERG